MPPVSLWLEIAALRLQLTLPTPALREALCQRWGAFVLPAAAPPAWHARITVVAPTAAQPAFVGGGPSLLTLPLTFRPTRLTWQAPASSVAGYVALDLGEAVLLTAAPHLLEEIEYLVRLCYIYMTHAVGGAVLHGAGLARAGRGYVFLGPSGTGKTTAARVSLAAGRAELLNDDLLVARPTPTGWWIYGTPFGNPTQLPSQTPRAVPLGGLFRLRQAKQVACRPLAPAVAVAEVLANLPVLNQDPHRLPQGLDCIKQLVTAHPVQQLDFLPDASFWDVIVAQQEM